MQSKDTRLLLYYTRKKIFGAENLTLYSLLFDFDAETLPNINN